jgi:hypothetical protein
MFQPKAIRPVTARGLDPKDIREAIRKKLRARIARPPVMSDPREGSRADLTPGDPMEDLARPPGMR